MAAKKKANVPATVFRPLHNYLVIKRPAKESETESGILISIGAREESTSGQVLAIGPGTYDHVGVLTPVTGIKVGDTVLFAKKGGIDIKSNGEEVLFLKSKEVIAVVGA
jgi:chaperonin GroES